MKTPEEQAKEFLEKNPEVARSVELWATAVAKYEEVMRGFFQMPRVYGGGSTAASPPPAAQQ